MPLHSRRSLCTASFAVLAILACNRDEPSYARFSPPWTRFIDVGDGDGIAAAFDRSRLVVHGDTVEVWMRFQYDEPVPLPGAPDRTYSAMEMHQAVRCAAGQTSDLLLLVRDSTGDSLWASAAEVPHWVPFSEHGLTERAFLRLCGALRR